MEDFKSNFDISAGVTYLNTPGNGLIPQGVKQWRREFEQEFYSSGTNLRDRQQDFINTVKQELSSFFNGSPEHTFLTPNFSFAYNAIINLLPPTFTYLLLEDEYPSLAYPLIAQRRAHHSIPVTADVETQLMEAVTYYSPDVLVISITQYISGLQIDSNFFKKLKHQHPELIIIADGTQFLGTQVFDFAQSGIDAIAASGYKWLLSGFGNGFLMLNETLQQPLNERVSDIPPPTVPMWAGKTTLHTFFEPGHQDCIAFGTLRESLRFMQRQGMQRIETHLQTLTQYAYNALSQRGWLLPHIQQRDQRSPLINVQIDPRLYPKLQNHKIMCFPRGTGIRIGLHLYNNPTDVDRLIDLIEKQ